MTSPISSVDIIRLMRTETDPFKTYLEERRPFVVVDNKGEEQFIPPLNTDIRFGGLKRKHQDAHQDAHMIAYKRSK
jgi:hypothetical protein